MAKCHNLNLCILEYVLIMLKFLWILVVVHKFYTMGMSKSLIKFSTSYCGMDLVSDTLPWNTLYYSRGKPAYLLGSLMNFFFLIHS